MEITLESIKGGVDALMSGFEEYKGVNDARLATLEQGGGVADLEAKLSKIDKFLDRQEDHNKKVTLAVLDEKNGMVARVEAMETALNRPGLAGASAKAAEETAYLESKAIFMDALRGRELTADQIKVLVRDNDTTGGFLAPTEYVRELIKGEIDFSPFRALARVRSTLSRSVSHPKRTGTFSATWVGEVATRTEATGLTYGLEEIQTHEMSALVDISNLDLEDSVFDLESELNMEFREQFGVAEGTAFIAGNAVAKPEGILENGDVGFTVSGDAALIASSASGTAEGDGMVDLFYDLKTAYARNASWLLNRNSIGSVRKLKDSNNQYLWQMGVAAGAPNTILGAPYMEMPDMPDEGSNTFPVFFGDWRRGYIIVDRLVLSVLRDPFTQASTGTVRFIARRRVGGQVVLVESMRKLKCSV